MAQRDKTEHQKDTEGDSRDRNTRKQCYYRIRFRSQGREYTAESSLPNLRSGTLVMVRTDHGPEPAVISGRAAGVCREDAQRQVLYTIQREASREEEEKYARLSVMEAEAYTICLDQIRDLNLPMHLVRVERFFNGSKIIFYFTAENRVDFRELVKRLVQEFRTRVEMRQIGVRHETQMTGGLGACGRELCCASFLRKFESVSIKMAKAQDLPLNPAKISGVCNRLLCCLTYEYEGYQGMKKDMPRTGRLIRLGETVYKVIRHMPLQGTLLVVDEGGEERLLLEEEWRSAKPVQRPKPKPKKRKRSKKGKKGKRQQPQGNDPNQQQ